MTRPLLNIGKGEAIIENIMKRCEINVDEKKETENKVKEI